jgi:hypothetical protein
MKEQSLLHVKIDYDVALQSKKNLLSSERDFIRLIKTIKRYNLLRKEDLNTKLKLQNKMKELKMNLEKLNTTLPKIKIPNILKKDNLHEEKSLKIKKSETPQNLENQLQEIQERLRKLE